MNTKRKSGPNHYTKILSRGIRFNVCVLFSVIHLFIVKDLEASKKNEKYAVCKLEFSGANLIDVENLSEKGSFEKAFTTIYFSNIIEKFKTSKIMVDELDRVKKMRNLNVPFNESRFELLLKGSDENVIVVVYKGVDDVAIFKGHNVAKNVWQIGDLIGNGRSSKLVSELEKLLRQAKK